jgi:hypothetical protein
MCGLLVSAHSTLERREAIQMKPVNGKEVRTVSEHRRVTEAVGKRTYPHIYHAPRPWNIDLGISRSTPFTARRVARHILRQWQVTLWNLPELIVIEVSDENEKPPEVQVADQESQGGRGLVIVEALSREWSYYYPRPGWKTVYCVIDAKAS